MMAYLAAVAAHPAYTSRFQSDLVQPGLRFPITADASLFTEASEIGREVIWLHCFGERFVDPSAGRSNSVPRMPDGERPIIPKNGAIPTDPDHFPDRIDYDAATSRLKIGGGYIENVSRAVWEYEVSDKQVLVQWFSYRRLDRSRPIIGDRRSPSLLEKIQPDGWMAVYTTELMNVLHVLGRLVALEDRQADLLNRICDGSLLNEMTSAQAERSTRLVPDAAAAPTNDKKLSSIRWALRCCSARRFDAHRRANRLRSLDSRGSNFGAE